MKNYNYRKKKRAEKTADIKRQLEYMNRMGAELFVDGEKLGSAAAALKVVREENSYMADFVLDRQGNVEQIRFDRIDPGK